MAYLFQFGFWLEVAGSILGLFLFVRGFPILKRKRLIENVPTSTVRSAALGLVELSGKAVGPYSIVAPISQMDCFFYRATISGGGGSDRSAREEVLCVPFFLDDGTGKILIDPRDADSALHRTGSEDLYGFVPEYLDCLLRRHGVEPGTPVRVNEYSVREGDHLYVIGALQENTCASSQPFPFLSPEASDLNREMVFSDLGRVERKSIAQADRFELNPAIIVRKGRKGDPFILSSSSERDLVSQLAFYSFISIWGGATIALWSLWLLVRNFTN